MSGRLCIICIDVENTQETYFLNITVNVFKNLSILNVGVCIRWFIACGGWF